MKVKELIQCWQPTGILRLDLPILKAILEVKQLEKFLAENMPRRKAG